VALIVSLALAQDYAFPTTADDYAAFYPTAYKDHDGVDWNCGDIRYSGHNGSDFGGGSWTGMEEGRDITAAADGTVLYTNDGEFDECSTGDCDGGGGFGNYVAIQHADGKTTWYGHLKQWSVLVSAGQYVACGTKLGEMGSSGHSTGPHIHFEVRESSGYASDPFDGPCSGPPTYWVDQGVWDGLPGLVCENVPACTIVDQLSCGETIATANNGGGSTATHAAYGCGEYTYSGSEIAYAFSTPLDEVVTIDLTGNSADVDMFVLSSDACDTTGSVACSVSPDASAETVSFTAAAGATYTVVVDGWEGAVSAFNLSATCVGESDADTDADTDADADTDTDVDTDTVVDDTGAPVAGTPGDLVRLDLLGCGGSGAGALAGLWIVGRRRRR
jgi:hypothetical protein